MLEEKEGGREGRKQRKERRNRNKILVILTSSAKLCFQYSESSPIPASLPGTTSPALRMKPKGCQMGGSPGSVLVNTPCESARNLIQIPSLPVFSAYGYHRNDCCI